MLLVLAYLFLFQTVFCHMLFLLLLSILALLVIFIVPLLVALFGYEFIHSKALLGTELASLPMVVITFYSLHSKICYVIIRSSRQEGLAFFFIRPLSRACPHHIRTVPYPTFKFDLYKNLIELVLMT